jgi:hypothetical protein
MSRVNLLLKVGACVSLLLLDMPGIHAQTAQSSGGSSCGLTSDKPIAIKITVSGQQFIDLANIMHSDHDSCLIEDMNPNDDASMIILCGMEQPKTTFVP